MNVRSKSSRAATATRRARLTGAFREVAFEARRRRVARAPQELHEIKQDMMQLMNAALEAGNRALEESSEPYVISGERNLLTAQDLALKNPQATREQIREYLSGNYCRCTGYHAIVDAIESVAKARAGKA